MQNVIQESMNTPLSEKQIPMFKPLQDYIYIKSNSNTVWFNFQTYIYIYIGGGCGRVVQGAGRKAKRMVLQCINGVGSNPVEGRTKL